MGSIAEFKQCNDRGSLIPAHGTGFEIGSQQGVADRAKPMGVFLVCVVGFRTSEGIAKLMQTSDQVFNGGGKVLKGKPGITPDIMLWFTNLNVCNGTLVHYWLRIPS